MKAIYFNNGHISMQQFDVPEAKPGEALLKPILCGICGTDLELLRGYYDFTGIAGHEFIARVEKAPGREDLEAERVVSDINVGCGNCERCRQGKAKHCVDRKILGIKGLNGAFAEYLTAPVANLHLVDSMIPDVEAVFAEPLAAALQITQQVDFSSVSQALVLGDGKLGLLIALALRPLVEKLTLAGRHEQKMKIAADQGVNVETTAALLADDSKSFPVVIEATGRPEGLEKALLLVEPEGTIVLKTTIHLPSKLDAAYLTVNEITVKGSRCGDLADALDFLRLHPGAITPMIDAVYSFDEFEKAFEHAKRPDSLKILLNMLA